MNEFGVYVDFVELYCYVMFVDKMWMCVVGGVVVMYCVVIDDEG